MPRRIRSSRWVPKSWLPVALVTAAVALVGCSGKQDFGRKETRISPKVESRTDPVRAADTNTQLGQAYLAKGQLDLAMDKLQRALELDPRNADTHTVIAIVYEQIGKMTEAEKHYRNAQKLKPESGLTANNLGRFLCGQGRYDDADKMFVRALADPFYKAPETAKLNRGVCARKAGNTAFAKQQLREVLALKPEDPVALWSLAEMSFAENEFMRARAFYERWLSANTESAQSLSFGMMIEDKLGNSAQVAKYKKQLIERFPESEEAARHSQEKSP